MPFRRKKSSGEQTDELAAELVTAGWHPEVAEKVLRAFSVAYWSGDYERARVLVSATLRAAPTLEKTLAVYEWRCREALRRWEEASAESGTHASELADWVLWQDAAPTSPWRLPSWLRRRPKTSIRCKWCGAFQEPHSFAGTDPRENSCSHCGRPFAAPDLYWDSMDGFASSAGRGSWGSHQDVIYGEWTTFFEELGNRHPDELSDHD